MIESAIELKHLEKQYQDVKAVDDLSLQVGKGELFGLLGPNGAGKTTTISILCGLIKPTSGSATVCGYDVQKEPTKVKEKIGVCIQETAIYPFLTGAENVDLFGNLNSMNKETLKSRKNLLLDKMGLAEDAKRKAEKYSGGMKRRLSLILALIHDPEIAFLDEPTVAMDPHRRGVESAGVVVGVVDGAAWCQTVSGCALSGCGPHSRLLPCRAAPQRRE